MHGLRRAEGKGLGQRCIELARILPDRAGDQPHLDGAPFFDAGRVWDRVSEISLDGWKYSAGSGLRISWNQATILMCDVGFSPEDWGIYFNFGHIF